MRTAIKVILVLAAAFIVLFALLLFFNTRATSMDENEVRDRNTVDHHEGETIEVSPSFFLTSSTEPSMPAGTKRRNTVHHWRGKSRWTGSANPTLAARGCLGLLTVDRAFNRLDQFIFLIQVRGSWCWRNGRVTSYSFSRDTQVGDQFWNFIDQTPLYRQPVRGVHNDHIYNRQSAIFQIVWLGQVVKEQEAWVSQTLRGNGTAAWDWKGRHL